MTLKPANKNQIPDQAILDAYNKQTYLGNGYVCGLNSTEILTTSEFALMYVQNPAITASAQPSGYTSLFCNLRRIACVTASQNVTLRLYQNPTVAAANVWTIVAVADSAGSLNSTYFLASSVTADYYVWFDNGSGVDPAVSGRTGIHVTYTNNASGSTLGGLIRTACAGKGWVVTGAGANVILTNSANGPTIAASDGTAPTGFSFTHTAGVGSLLTPTNLRTGSANTSISACSLNPIASVNGTLIEVLGAPVGDPDVSNMLTVIDNGKSLLVTVQTSSNTTFVMAQLGWYEL